MSLRTLPSPWRGTLWTFGRLAGALTPAFLAPLGMLKNSGAKGRESMWGGTVHHTCSTFFHHQSLTIVGYLVNTYLSNPSSFTRTHAVFDTSAPLANPTSLTHKLSQQFSFLSWHLSNSALNYGPMHICLAPYAQTDIPLGSKPCSANITHNSQDCAYSKCSIIDYSV